MTDLSKKRVLIVPPSMDALGGAERQALLLASGLSAAGAHVEVWGPGELGRVARECRTLGVKASSVNLELKGSKLRLWWNLRVFRTKVKEGRFDWIVPYANAPNIYSGLAWRKSGASACFWNQRDEGKNLGRKRVRQAIENIELFVSNSSHGATMLEGRFPETIGKTRVVRNGVVGPAAIRSREEVRDELNIETDAPIALMLGNITSRKRQDVLVRAWRLVVRVVPEARLILAGYHGNNADSIKSLVNELELNDQILMPGSVADVGSLIGAADLCTFSSDREGCPNGVLECMAAGLAVVATDIPGIREIWNGVNEQLVPPDSHEQYAEQIIQMFSNPSIRLKLGSENQHIIERDFSVQGMIENTVSLLSELEAGNVRN